MRTRIKCGLYVPNLYVSLSDIGKVLILYITGKLQMAGCPKMISL